MLQEAADELVGRHRHGAIPPTAALTIGEGDTPQAIRSGFALHHSPVADRHPVDCPEEAFQGGLADGVDELIDFGDGEDGGQFELLGDA